MAEKKKARLTPVDIKNAKFKTTIIGGLKKSDVETFLEKVAQDYGEILKENKELENTLTQMRIKVLEADEIKTDYEKIKDKNLILEGETEALRRENQQLRSKLSEYEDLVEALKLENAEKEAIIDELKRQLENTPKIQNENPSEIIEIARKTALKIKQKTIDDIEKAFESFPEPLKVKIKPIIERAKKELLS
ncbi:MAG: DivIVA domain-containing protein [candidate division WOR-3 bacterium]|nr:DivIVA domain-containing protein [candidate division WOR-3 bacterium]MCX7947933.1 DivIVA domain-containing protein [candidate division WOR-3 bacterium]MDW8150877.1 DivIVA domain-containing protein [candidate division WOR-3 bacterium]